MASGKRPAARKKGARKRRKGASGPSRRPAQTSLPGERRRTGRPGRPAVTIDYNLVLRKALSHPPDSEYAAFFHCSKALIKKARASKERQPVVTDPEAGTVEDLTFAEAEERGKALSNLRLRDKQQELAEAGEVRLLIHLGKVRLGQRETARYELTTPPDAEAVRIEGEYRPQRLGQILATLDCAGVLPAARRKKAARKRASPKAQ